MKRALVILLLSMTQTVFAQAPEPERSYHGFLMGFDAMGGVGDYRGAHRNGGLRLGIRIRPVAAIGFDIGFGAAFLGHRYEGERLGGVEGSVHLDVRSYFNGGGIVQPFIVGGLRYGRFFATNAEDSCPSEHGGPTGPIISTNMSFYDLSAGVGHRARAQRPRRAGVGSAWSSPIERARCGVSSRSPQRPDLASSVGLVEPARAGDDGRNARPRNRGPEARGLVVIPTQLAQRRSDKRGMESHQVLYFVGAFSMLAAAANWGWFFRHRKAARMVRLFGRRGARTLYFFLGLTLCVLAFRLRGF